MNKKNINGVIWLLIIILILLGLSLSPLLVINKQLEQPVIKEQEEITVEEPKQEEKEPEKQEQKKENTVQKKTETNTKKQNTVKSTTKTNNKSTNTVKKSTTTTQKSQTTGTYKITHYGWDCCKSGVTATGYNVKNTIYYNDKQYGQVRIVAMSKAMPLYSIIKIKNYKFGGDIIAIVIDRGVGNGVIDLLVENEKTASKYGIQKGVNIEVLRKGK